MNSTTTAIFRGLARATRPLELLIGVLLYTLGGGIAISLGFTLHWDAFLVGLLIVLLIQLSSFYLNAYFDLVNRPPFERIAPPPWQDFEEIGERLKGSPPDADSAEPDGTRPRIVEPPRTVFLYVAAATLTTGAALTVLLYAEGRLPPAAFLFLGLAFLLALAYSVPPLRLVYSGYGELAVAILEANLFPAFAFLLQAGELNGRLAQLTFPLTFLYLAYFLATSLQRFMEDIRQNRQTLLIRLGWQRGMTLHNALIAGAYVLLAVAVIAGLPWRIAWPAFLSLPVAVFQVWQINAIGNGAKPRWRLLALTALATLVMAIYFMNLSSWTG